MADALLSYLRPRLPGDIAHLIEPHLVGLENGDYQSILSLPEARLLYGHERHRSGQPTNHTDVSWDNFISQNLDTLLAGNTGHEKPFIIFCIGYAALLAFLQSNVTGTPLPFSSAKTLLPLHISSDAAQVRHLRRELIANLGQDGIAAYKLTPNVELLCLANTIMTYPAVLGNVPAARWAKMRVSFIHQRLLSEVSSTMRNLIYDDLGVVADELLDATMQSNFDVQTQVEFLLERSTIHIHHGLDKFARLDLDQATSLRQFEFRLTGHLGKRTKFQTKETSQLVVLAKSHKPNDVKSSASNEKSPSTAQVNGSSKPTNLNLNDDTLLEAISFSKDQSSDGELPSALSELNPAHQPELDALDATILLSFASSITNTNPQNGLTREETLPYATRVIDGGSSNWQVYSQALLVRSRIEGYKSRTIERGLLQLQALVDQVIADTFDRDATEKTAGDATQSATSFLPRPTESDSAPPAVRLRYIFQLASPLRWDLEAELAARWVHLGGLRSALEIYERLEMWADAALCWAATDNENKARKMVRRQLFERTRPSSGAETVTNDEAKDDDGETWEGPERVPAPLDAPRLYCILGDLDSSPEMYEKAWEVSKERYARAQRSLGRFYLGTKAFDKAADAYGKSLRANQLHHPSWFSLGCCWLELSQFEKAASCFSRCVQLDDTDGESWSNLAAALLRCEQPQASANATTSVVLDDDEDDAAIDHVHNHIPDNQKNRLNALKALKRAAGLKRESWRVWQNLLIVAASLSPPDFATILSAQKHLITLRASTEGEACLDTEILSALTHHVIAEADTFDASRPGLARLFVRFVDESVVPLITGSPELWRLVGKLALWRNRPTSALEAEEKAWRVVTAQPGWETDREDRWNDVVDATIRLCDAYENFGPRERTEGLAAGELVAKDWKFKARSAIRGILGRGKASWEDSPGWDRLMERSEELKN